MASMIGDRLRHELSVRGWDQREFSARSGISEAAISRHINNEREPQLECLVEYARALSIPLAELTEARLAKVYKFPARYPTDPEDGFAIVKRGGSWFLCRHERGRITETRVTVDEIQRLHDLTDLVLKIS